MVSKSTSLNSGGRATVFSIPMTDWNALLRLSLFTLLMTFSGLTQVQAQCNLMYDDPTVDVELTVNAMGQAVLDDTAIMPYVTVTGAGCTVFNFYDALGNPLVSPVTISCNGTGNGPGSYIATVEDMAAPVNLSNTVTFNVVLIDNIPPTFTVPADIAINCDQDKDDLMITGDATGEMDNCATGIQATYTDDVSMLTGCNSTGTISREWSLSDGSNPPVIQTQIITVQDVTQPTFSAPADVTIDACSDDINDLSITGMASMENDNCSMGITATYQDMPAVAVAGMCRFDSTITRVWSLVDDCNNILQLNQTITKEDRSVPESTQAAINVDNNTGACNGTVSLVLDAANTTDNCSAFADLTITNSFNANGANASGTYPVGSTTVTFTITDQCMNVGMHDVIVTVADTTAPTIVNCPADITVNNDPGDCDNTLSWTAPSATDNCSSVANITETITAVPDIIINKGTPGAGRVDFADFPVGVTTVTYAFRDQNGQTETCEFSVTVLDTIVPIVTCPAAQTLDFGGCNAPNVIVPDYRSLLNVSDNCSNGYTVTQTPAQNTLLSGVAGVTPADGESFTVTITATDNNALNLSASCSFVVTLNEDGSITPTIAGTNLPSVISTCGPVDVCAPTAKDECGNLLEGTPNPGAGAIVSGTCDAPCDPQPTFVVPFGGPIDILPDNDAAGTNITLTVSGLSGTIADMDFQMALEHTFVGDLKATITSPDGTTTVDLFDRPGVPATTFGCGQDDMNVTFDDQSTNTAADLEVTCGTPAVVGDFQPLGAFSAFEGMDPNGNWTLNISDNGPGDTGSLTAASFDFCTFSGATVNQYTFSAASNTVIWSFDDLNGNTLTQFQQIDAANDTQGPTITCEDITIELDEDGTKLVSPNSVLGESIIFESSDGNFEFLPGTTEYCYAASAATTIEFDWVFESEDIFGGGWDPFGYRLNGTFNQLTTGLLNVFAPIPDPESLNQSGTFSIDLAPGDEFCIVISSLDNFPLGSSTEVTNLFVNNAAYTPSEWRDTTTGITDNPDLIFNNAVATDNCGVDFTTLTIDGAASWEANCGNIGMNSATISIDDINGNTSTCITNITVVDALAPTLNMVPNDTTVTCGNIPAVVDPTVTDNCSSGLTPIINSTSTQSGNPNTCSNYSYVITRTWSTTDNSGNMASAVQTITVEDNDAPTNPAFTDNIGLDNEISTDANQCDATVSLALTSADDCAPFANLTITNNSIYATSNGADASGNYPVGTHNINFNVSDPCGNSVSFNRVFTVADDVSPIAICKSVTLGLPSNGNLTLLPGFINDGSTDNCSAQGDLTYSVSPTNFDCSHADGVTQWPVTLTVTDENLNSATCNSFVVIQDNFLPTVNCQDITIELDQNSMATITVADIDNGSFDNCTATSDLIFSLSKTTFNETNVGINQVQLSVEDSNGNIGSCFATVTVQLPQVCLTVGAMAGPSGTVVTVPVTVSDFTNVGSFQFYLLASDPTILDIQDVRALPNLGFGSFVTNEIGDDSIRVSYSIPGVPLVPVTLADGEAIIEIDILLTGMVNDFSFLTLTNDDPNGFPLNVSHYFNGVAFPFNPLCTFQGGVTINAPASLRIAGDIFTEDADPVGSVYVDAVDGTPSIAGSDQTGTDGIYDIFPVFSSQDYVITPMKDTNWTNGVTPFDLSVIQQHIVGLDTLDSPYKKIAADAFEDGLITTFDVLQLQILLASAVGGPANVIAPPNLTSWVFVPALDTPAMTAPLFVPSYTQSKTIVNLTMDSLDNDFIGIKIGDVTGNADPSSIVSDDSDNRSLTDNLLITEDIRLNAGATIAVPFSLEKDAEWIAGQWVFDFNPADLQFVDVNITPNSGLKEADFGTDFVNRGKLSIVNYDAVARLSKANDVLFELVFDVITDQLLSEVLAIDESVLSSEIYAADGEKTNIGIGFIGSVENPIIGDNTLMQNRPNPFVDQTVVSFILADGGQATLTFTDVSGRIIKVIDQEFAKGYNELQLSKNDLPEDGIYFYRIESGDFNAVKKMTLLKK